MQELDAATLAKCFLAGAGELIRNKGIINELNVFPVPDGDTGTNMSMTISSAAKEVRSLGKRYDMKELCRAISMGSLRGARGNSGVILSQLLRGFTKTIAEQKTVNISVLAQALERGTDTAYKAVMKPKEGTILSVARAASDKAMELSSGPELTIEAFAEGVFKSASEALERTPEQLPVLKEAGVVDSGGRGLLELYRGCLDVLSGKEIELWESEGAEGNSEKAQGTSPRREVLENAEITFGYCTEFIIKLEREFNEGTERAFKAFLESIGDSIVCVSMDDIVKVHVHTDHPGQAFERALTFGQLTNMKIDNMREEHHERLFDMSGAIPRELETKESGEKSASEGKEKEKPKQYGFISVCSGDGLKEIFLSLGADIVIEGGQTMNPSTEDILSAIEEVNADTVFILPNNSNIILAANQAASMSEGKRCIVLPSKTVPQGIAALINFIPEHDTDENIREMVSAFSVVKTGLVTYAVRSTTVDGHEIKAGDYMGLGEGHVLSLGKDLGETCISLVDSLMEDDSELVCIFYGESVSAESAERLAGALRERFPDVELELQNGGQPVYYYIVSVE
ncbi:MAG: DAK2 domain-containing protein [Lachnospiraceae bacterium]|nr:DAK2 domain-containing protein [Lachnospiraceae bacterium]